MTGPLFEIAHQILEAQAVLIDWDGCLARSDSLLPGAREFLLRTAHKAHVLSNNSTDLPETFSAQLASAGISLPPDRISLAGHQALCQVAVRWIGRRVHLVGSAQMRRYAQGLRIDLVEDDADVVVLLRDPEFNYAKLSRAANVLRRCRHLVLSNPDLTHPANDDAIVPETGALLAALSACIDESVDIEAIGKPEPFLFEVALKRAGVTPDAALMIGDNPATDGAGAARCGIPFIYVGHAAGLSLESLAPAVEALSEQSQNRFEDRTSNVC